MNGGATCETGVGPIAAIVRQSHERVMLDETFAEINVSGVKSLPAVLVFVVFDSDQVGGLARHPGNLNLTQGMPLKPLVFRASSRLNPLPGNYGFGHEIAVGCV